MGQNHPEDEDPPLAMLSLLRGSYASTTFALLILLSFPRPLIPLFAFRYRPPKYSHISFSQRSTTSPSRIFSKRYFNRRIVST